MQCINASQFVGPRAYFTNIDHRLLGQQHVSLQLRRAVERELKVLLLTKQTVVCAASHLKGRFAYDQFAWGQRAFDLGVGTAPIPRKSLTASNLATAIQQTTQPQLRAQAANLAAQIATEQGAAQCAAVVAGI